MTGMPPVLFAVLQRASYSAFMEISYAVQNLRNLGPMPTIALRPITILVGRNSAGKSTFLRSFALIRQSLEVRSSAPILWYGDYVDFGDFRAASNFGNLDNEIIFKFILSDYEANAQEDELYLVSTALRQKVTLKIKYDQISLSIALGHKDDKTVRRSIALRIDEHDITVQMSLDDDGQRCTGMLVNGQDALCFAPNHGIYFSADNIFAQPIVVYVEPNEKNKVIRSRSGKKIFSEGMISSIRNLVDKRIAYEKLEAAIDSIPSSPKMSKAALQELAEKSSIASFKKL